MMRAFLAILILMLVLASGADTNSKGWNIERVATSSGGGVSTQPNGWSLTLTVGNISSSPATHNASGASLQMGFQTVRAAPEAGSVTWLGYR